MISRLTAQPRRARRVTVPITGLAVLLAGACTPVAENPWASGPAGGSHTSVASPTAVATPPSEGVTARPVSTANALEGRHLRLVRLGTDDLVLQFDMVNTGTLPAGPGTLAYVTTPPLRVADLPRGTDYEVQTEVKESPFNPETRIDTGGEWLPNRPVTITAVYPAPPPEATQLLVSVEYLVPVLVPVEAAGAPLKDDPVLHRANAPGNYISSIACEDHVEAPAGGTSTPVRLRLPSDVLFEFDKATLTATAAGIIDEFTKQIEAKSGTITVVGHTDAKGTDAYNQTLSEQRAAAVLGVLQAKLGGAFGYEAVGRGETEPIAPNEHPDGTDDPDGRAQNRRVEVGVATTATTVPTATPTALDTGYRDLGLRVDATTARRLGIYLLVTVDVHNPSGAPVKIGLVPTDPPFLSGPAPRRIIVIDRTTQTRHRMCESVEPQSSDPLGNSSADYSQVTAAHDEIPPGGTVTLHGLYSAPGADVSSVDVEVNGLGAVVPTPITAG